MRSPDINHQPTAEQTAQRRHKRFEDSHQQMIETAVRLISEKGLDSLSIAAVARAMGFNRTAVYYHFDSREALVSAVKTWSAAQLARAFSAHSSQQQRIDYITRFVLENPDLIKLWIEEFVSGGDIRGSYPHWDALVEGIRTNLTDESSEDAVDAEVFCVMLLTGAIIGPRVFKNRVRPDEDTETVVRRFRKEQQRWLKRLALLRP
jgi:AcrR family transcriptional regulator